jgi:phospholipid/cholesterol/gamma-HCH transport system substrate-binding protein
MAASQDARVIRWGIVALLLALLISVATFNLSKFPGFRGTTYYAEFSDASGLRTGNIVQVAGIRVGRVDGVELDGDRVRVKFEVDGHVEFGPETTASVEVYNLLGEKYLNLEPVGDGRLAAGGTIPLDRTQAAYDIVAAFGDLTETTEQIDTDQLAEALTVVGDTLNESAPEMEAAVRGISRISESIASRDAELIQLLDSSAVVTEVLQARSDDIVELMEHAGLVFQELSNRQEAVRQLLRNSRSLARELRGLVKDNEDQIGPALAEVEELTGFLVEKKQDLKDVLSTLGPYVFILSNILGTGPWFDAYAVNLLAIPTGEFVSTIPDGIAGIFGEGGPP